MKQAVILRNNGGRLANQIWQYAAVFAYALATGRACSNPAFWQYRRYFNLPDEWFLVSILSLLSRWTFLQRPLRLAYALLSRLVMAACGRQVVTDGGQEFLLPPSAGTDREATALAQAGQGGRQYFCGWLFRNPAGLEKYQGEIRQMFAPRQPYSDRVAALMAQLRKDHQVVVGVHIRRGDYKTWDQGRNFYDWHEVRRLLESYLASRPETERAQTVFLLASDEEVRETEFAGLDCRLAPGHELLDLYALAASDLIIGANSTYGAWAAYYGGLPFVRFSREQITWPAPRHL